MTDLPIAEPEATPRRAGRLKQAWQRVADVVTWVPPTRDEVGTVAKSALAAGLAWMVSAPITGVDEPILASLTAIVVVQVSARGSFRTAIERTIAVVIGVLAALAIGDAITLDAFTVTLLVGASLALAELVLRLPRSAARQVPVSVLVVLTTVSVSDEFSSLNRAADTVIGAAVGVTISLVLPASRLLGGRQTLHRLAIGLHDALMAMSEGLRHDWSTEQTEEWRGRAREVRARMVGAAAEAIGNSRESIRWNFRDRGHIDELVRYEAVLTTFERAAIGVSVIARGIDDHARLSGTTHAAMPSIGELLEALAVAVDRLAATVIGGAAEAEFVTALDEVRRRRQRCVEAAARRAREALLTDADVDSDPGADEERRRLDGEWLNYAAILVQVDRIVADLGSDG